MPFAATYPLVSGVPTACCAPAAGGAVQMASAKAMNAVSDRSMSVVPGSGAPDCTLYQDVVRRTSESTRTGGRAGKLTYRGSSVLYRSDNCRSCLPILAGVTPINFWSVRDARQDRQARSEE